MIWVYLSIPFFTHVKDWCESGCFAIELFGERDHDDGAWLPSLNFGGVRWR
jgi:hypothetical protein